MKERDVLLAIGIGWLLLQKTPEVVSQSLSSEVEAIPQSIIQSASEEVKKTIASVQKASQPLTNPAPEFIAGASLGLKNTLATNPLTAPLAAVIPETTPPTGISLPNTISGPLAAAISTGIQVANDALSQKRDVPVVISQPTIAPAAPETTVKTKEPEHLALEEKYGRPVSDAEYIALKSIQGVLTKQGLLGEYASVGETVALREGAGVKLPSVAHAEAEANLAERAKSDQVAARLAAEAAEATRQDTGTKVTVPRGVEDSTTGYTRPTEWSIGVQKAEKETTAQYLKRKQKLLRQIGAM